MDISLFDRREIYRYMGISEQVCDEHTAGDVEYCIKELSALPEPKWVYRYDTVTITPEGVRLPNLGLVLPGRDLADHLRGCEFCGVMAVTLGDDFDRVLRRVQIGPMVRALAADACGTAAVESACNRVEEIMVAENPGKFTSFRFSPGYGDLPISVQPHLLEALDARRRIGLWCTPAHLLVPTKSVTAILGFSHKPLPPGKRGCTSCALRETCQFRKKGETCGS